MEKKKMVAVGMSGGVDSSVAAAVLLERGYDVVGLTMKTYSFDEVGGNVGNESSCCGLDAFNDARMVAVRLGIPHYVLDVTREFGQEVIDNFVEEYLRGRTPNPCIICNRSIKWGQMLSKARSLGAEFIATGHYARLSFDGSLNRYVVSRARDAQKDQTYALWAVGQEALARTLFPLSELTKGEVRDLAARYGLPIAHKEESFEICFVADNDYRRFVGERVTKSGIPEGDILFKGAVVGKHRGLPYYTVGQRSGIGAFGERMYVTGIHPGENTVTIGRAGDLLHRELVATGINMVSVPELTPGMEVEAQIRYKDTPGPARVYPEAGGKLRVVFDEPKRAITPGQSLVMYRGQVLLGGGIIEGPVAEH